MAGGGRVGQGLFPHRRGSQKGRTSEKPETASFSLIPGRQEWEAEPRRLPGNQGVSPLFHIKKDLLPGARSEGWTG